VDKTMDNEIDLRDIFRALWKNRFLIVGIFVISLLVSGLVSLAMPSIYRASCTVVLGNFSDPIYATETMAANIMLSDELLLNAINQLNLDVPPEKFKGFKEGIKIEHVTDNVLTISVETSDQQNATNIVKKIGQIFINLGEEHYNKYRNHLSAKLAITQENLAVVEREINQTSEVLRNIDMLPGISQEQLELSHSRTLEYLQNEESRHSSLQGQYIELKRQMDVLANARILAISEEPFTRVRPQRILIVAVGGMIGLMIGIFAAFFREGLRRREKS
jgi:capsular polysaccharide biosynthesis protein